MSSSRCSVAVWCPILHYLPGKLKHFLNQLKIYHRELAVVRCGTKRTELHHLSPFVSTTAKVFEEEKDEKMSVESFRITKTVVQYYRG